MKRLGILGGTFNPVHNGHLALADLATASLGLDLLLFVPAAQPALVGGLAVCAEDRLAMTRLAVQGNRRYAVSDIEPRWEGTCFTVDVLRELSSEFGAGVEFFFITGSDVLRGFRNWKEPEAIRRIARLAVSPDRTTSGAGASWRQPFPRLLGG